MNSRSCPNLLIMMVSFLLLMSSCQKDSPKMSATNAPIRESSTLNESIIYSLAMEQFLIPESQFFIYKRSVQISQMTWNDYGFTNLSPDTLTSFNTLNSNPSIFSSDFSLGPEFAIVFPDFLWSRYDSGDPQAPIDAAKVRIDYPGYEGAFKLSRIGFDAEARQALVQLLYISPFGVCEHFKATLLTRAKHEWEVIDTVDYNICS